MPSALITGATGYIGGQWYFVPFRLKHCPKDATEKGPFLIWFKSQYSEYKIAATSRSPASTKLLQDFGVDVVETAGLEDMRKAASQADLVVNFADAASLPLVQAIIAGLKEHFEETTVRPILIHISGSATIFDPRPFDQSDVTSVSSPALVAKLSS